MIDSTISQDEALCKPLTRKSGRCGDAQDLCRFEGRALQLKDKLFMIAYPHKSFKLKSWHLVQIAELTCFFSSSKMLKKNLRSIIFKNPIFENLEVELIWSQAVIKYAVSENNT